MKALTLTTPIAIVMLFCNVTFAQDIAATLKNRTPEQKSTALTMMMKSKLNLDSAQTTKVQAINTKYALKTAPVLNGDGGKLAKFKQLRDIQKAKDAELKDVLNADQFKQYQALEEEMKDKLKENMKNKQAQ